MPKSKPFILHIATSDAPKYPSVQAFLEANAALMVELIREGAALRGVDPLTGQSLHSPLAEVDPTDTEVA